MVRLELFPFVIQFPPEVDSLHIRAHPQISSTNDVSILGVRPESEVSIGKLHREMMIWGTLTSCANEPLWISFVCTAK